MMLKIKLEKQTFGLYFIFTLILLLLLSVFFWNGSIFVIGVLGCLLFLPFIWNLDSEMYKVLFFAMIISFAWMLLQYFGLMEKFGKPYFGGDDEIFERYGDVLYKLGAYTIADCPSFGYNIDKATGFMLILAWIMRISNPFGGYHTISPRILNIYMWLAIGVMVYKFVKKSELLQNDKVLRKVVLGLMIFPNALFVNSCVYRDTLSIYVLFVCVYLANELSRKNSVEKIMKILPIFLIFVISIYILYYVRSDLLIALAGLVVFQIFWADGTKSKFAKRILLAVLVISVGGSYTLNKVNTMLNNYNHYLLVERNAINGMSGKIFSTPIFPFGIFLRFIWGQMQPFPGEIFTQDFYGSFLYAFISVVVRLGTVLHICCLPYIFKSVLKLNSDAMKYLLVYMMVIVTTFGFRHFLMVYPFAAIELYYGVKDVSRHNIRINTIFILAACGIAGLIYVSILGIL